MSTGTSSTWESASARCSAATRRSSRRRPRALLDEATRARIGQAAVDTAKAVDYRGAGTVEFIVSADDPDEFFFMEMNTRLQVEHPVTEQVTGVDLVEWQLRIGAGQQLALAQDEITLTGHSIEARIYAEDPARGFLPTGGTALDVSLPHGEGIRVDAGLEPGQRIVSDYDPMIAKLIVTARDRQEAVALMRTALAGSAVPGIVTNIGFLQTLLEMPEVVAGDLHTGLIDAMTEDDLAEAVDPAALQLAAAHVAAAEADRATDSHIAGEPVGMWADGSGWRGVAPARTVVPLVHRGERHDVEFLHPPVRALGDAADRSGAASGSVLGAPGAGSTLRLTLDGEQVTGRVWASATAAPCGCARTRDSLSSPDRGRTPRSVRQRPGPRSWPPCRAPSPASALRTGRPS